MVWTQLGSYPFWVQTATHASAGWGLACWCLDLIGRQTEKMDGVDRCYSSKLWALWPNQKVPKLDYEIRYSSDLLTHWLVRVWTHVVFIRNTVESSLFSSSRYCTLNTLKATGPGRKSISAGRRRVPAAGGSSTCLASCNTKEVQSDTKMPTLRSYEQN